MAREPGERLAAQCLTFGRWQSLGIEAMAIMQPREALQGRGVQPGLRLHPGQPFAQVFRLSSNASTGSGLAFCPPRGHSVPWLVGTNGEGKREGPSSGHRLELQRRHRTTDRLR